LEAKHLSTEPHEYFCEKLEKIFQEKGL